MKATSRARAGRRREWSPRERAVGEGVEVVPSGTSGRSVIVRWPAARNDGHHQRARCRTPSSNAVALSAGSCPQPSTLLLASPIRRMGFVVSDATPDAHSSIGRFTIRVAVAVMFVDDLPMYLPVAVTAQPGGRWEHRRHRSCSSWSNDRVPFLGGRPVR
jgi:hypothetical protein